MVVCVCVCDSVTARACECLWSGLLLSWLTLAHGWWPQVLSVDPECAHTSREKCLTHCARYVPCYRRPGCAGEGHPALCCGTLRKAVQSLLSLPLLPICAVPPTLPLGPYFILSLNRFHMGLFSSSLFFQALQPSGQDSQGASCSRHGPLSAGTEPCRPGASVRVA